LPFKCNLQRYTVVVEVFRKRREFGADVKLVGPLYKLNSVDP
jgi:hypothetical protein